MLLAARTATFAAHGLAYPPAPPPTAARTHRRRGAASRMRILHFTHSPPHYIPPPVLSPDQVVAGPATPDAEADGVARGIRTAAGAFDAASVAERLGGRWRPDLVVVRADSFAGHRPRNRACFACPVVLLVGDTHHAPPAAEPPDDPMMLDYARSEPFEAVCLDYTRQHAHFFVEAGLPRVCWLPGINVERMPFRACDDPFELRFSMAGQIGPRHPRRTTLVDSLRKAGLPLSRGEAPRQETRRIHATSQLNLNCSLNGDLNLRVLEVMQVGGALLTDRLSPEAGLGLLFEEGTHHLAYGDLEEAASMARDLLADEPRCRAMGAAGRAHYEATLSPEAMARQLLSIARGDPVPSLLDARQDARTRLVDGPEGPERLAQRVDAYWTIQAAHLRNERLTLLATPSVDGRMLADLVDLPRLRLLRHVDAAWPGAAPAMARTDAQLGKAGLLDRVLRRDVPAGPPPDLLLAAAEDARSGAAGALLDRYGSTKVVFVGGVGAADAGRLRIEPVPGAPGLWHRAPRRSVRTFKRR
jgi:hypothetical protein